jgi:hypothetical protein
MPVCPGDKSPSGLLDSSDVKERVSEVLMDVNADPNLP